MTSDNLLKFLGNRAYLHQVSYQELKSMVVEYPYSLSLRYLLAMKSHQEDNTDLDRNIEMLATYGIDRTHLHRIFSSDPIVLEDLEETILMGEDYLELKELSSLEREMESNLIENEIPSISFLEEELPIPSSPSATPASTAVEDLPTPPSIIEPAIEEEEEEEEEVVVEPIAIEQPDTLVEEAIAASAIIGGVSLIENKQASDDELVDTPTSLENPLDKESETVETPSEPDAEEEMEDFIVMDFEDPILDEVGIAVSSDDLAPSESFSTQDIEVADNGLPVDAVEVNDAFNDYKEEKEGKINDLFEEAEAEVLAEEAVSDANKYVDNPEELLVEEKEKVSTASTNSDPIPTESESAAIFQNEKEKATKRLKSDKPRPQIPFEISYAKIDPVPFEEEIAPTANEESVSTAAAIDKESTEEPAEIPQATVEEATAQVLPAPKVSKEPAETFKFDSLDQLEATFNQEKLTPTASPIPKSGFSSWQEKYSGVSAFSSINLLPLEKTTGKTIKKKKKIVRKEFEKTVALAEESLTMTDGIASETLAQLLVKQGQYSQARAMYTKLRLIMPEKSSFFAGEIEKIQNLP